MSKQPDPNAKRDFYTTDPKIREVGGQVLDKGQRRVALTAAEAAFGLANGVLTEQDPAAQKAATQAAKPAPAADKR